MGGWFHYKTSVGTVWIRPQPDALGRFELGIDNESLGSYHSPVAAADDVYTGHTGWFELDTLDGSILPCDLSEWEKGVPDNI